MSSDASVWQRAREPGAAKLSARGVVRAALVLAAAALLVALPLLVDDYVLSAILVPLLALSLAGIGQNLVTGYAGQLFVGAAAFMSVGAFAAYDVHLYLPSTPLLATFAAGGLVAAATGALFGLPSLRIRGFYLVVSTLAAQFFVEWLFTKVGWFSGNSSSGVITAPPLRIAGVSFSSPGGHYWLSLLVVAPLTLAAHNLVRGRIGRGWMAVRDMETAAAVVGVHVRASKLLAFAIGSFYCGVAGTFLGAAFIVLFPIALDQAVAAVAGRSVDPGLLQNLEKVLFGALVILLLAKQPAGLARLVEIAWIRARRFAARYAPRSHS